MLPLDDLRFITVEVLDNTGFNDHLPEAGVAIHLIDQRPSACGSPSGSCVNELRRQVPLLGAAPHTDLLGEGEAWEGEGWTVTVAQAPRAGSPDNGTWTIAIGP